MRPGLLFAAAAGAYLLLGICVQERDLVVRLAAAPLEQRGAKGPATAPVRHVVPIEPDRRGGRRG